MAFTKARSSRRFGARDDEPADLDAEIEALKNDPESDVKDYLGVIIDQCDSDQIAELSAALREIVDRMDRGDSLARYGEDRRSTRAMRRSARDARARMGGDDPLPSSGNLPPRGSVEGEDRRGRLAGDSRSRMAFDASPQATFNRMFPNASRVERA